MTGMRPQLAMAGLVLAISLAATAPAVAQSGGSGPVIGMPGGGCDSDFAARRGPRDTTAMLEPRGGCDGIMRHEDGAPQTRGARPKSKTSEPTGSGRAQPKPQPSERSR